ncbi:hypothetical protein DRQ07_00830 [candidate division KSB1 bacterium]|nr:MAG: hypothetical protein DRQ07_00830 [candidate division KSB1 bacterium]
MKCEKFQDQMFLLFTGEGSHLKQKRLLRHLQDCSKCQKVYNDTLFVMDIVNTNEDLKPSDFIRERIFEVSRNAEYRGKSYSKTVNIKNRWIFKPVLPVASAVIILMVILTSVFRPFIKHKSDFAWDDNFIAQVENLNDELTRLEHSRDIIDVDGNDENQISILSNDFEFIRRKIIEMEITN